MNTFDPSNGGNGNGSAPRQATLREFSAILFRRKWIVIGLFLVTIVTVLMISFTTATTYISAGSVYVKRGERESVLGPARRVLDDWEQALGTEMEIVKSEPVLSRAREILAAEAAGDTLILDPGAIEAEVKGKSNVMLIGYVDADPEVARKVCDAVIRAYVSFREREFMPSFTREFFESELAQVEDDLQHWSELRRDFANQTGVIDVYEQNRKLIGQLAVLEQRRSEAEADLAGLRTLQTQLQSLADNPNADLATFSALIEGEGALMDLKRKIVEQEARLAVLRERLREEAVDVVNARRTVATLQDLLTKELTGRARQVSSRIEQAEARLAVIDRDMTSIQEEIRSMPGKGARLAMMERELEILKQRREELTEKSDQALVTENTSSAVNVMLLESAGAPRPINARDYVRLALAPAFSIVVGIGLAFFVDSLDLTVRTARHAEEVAELPVLATLTDRRRRSLR